MKDGIYTEFQKWWESARSMLEEAATSRAFGPEQVAWATWQAANARPAGKEVSTPPAPTIGRIVHYTNLGDKDGRYPPEQQAAIITGVNPDSSVALKIFYKTGLFDMASVPFSETYERGHWSWPPR